MTTVTPVQHGTLGGYTNRSCRCLKCREANRAYSRRRRAERAALARQGAPEVPHGTNTGYGSWGCRCGACKDAHTLAVRVWRSHGGGRHVA